MNLDALLTRHEAALLAGVTVDVIDTWRWRGWLDSDGERRKLTPAPTSSAPSCSSATTTRRPYFVARDVLAAERDTRRSGKSNRRLRAAA